MRAEIGAAAVLAGTLLTASTPAEAHRPYFTQTGRIQLPDGTIGELRVLNGDGIFLADPARAVLLDRDGRLLARSRRTTTLVVSCPEPAKCRAVDLMSNEVLDPDPASFRQGPVLPGLDGDRDQLWEIEDGEESWGFRPRAATVAELTEAEIVHARENMHNLLPMLALGCLAALLAFVGVRRPPPATRPVRLGLWLIEVLVRVAGVIVISLACLYWFALTA